MPSMVFSRSSALIAAVGSFLPTDTPVLAAKAVMSIAGMADFSCIFLGVKFSSCF